MKHKITAPPNTRQMTPTEIAATLQYETALRGAILREKAADRHKLEAARKQKAAQKGRRAATKPRTLRIAAAERRVEAAARALDRSYVVNKFTFYCKVRLARAQRLLEEARR